MEYDYYCFKELCPQVLARESNGLGQCRSAIYFVGEIAPLRWGCSSVLFFQSAVFSACLHHIMCGKGCQSFILTNKLV